MKRFRLFITIFLFIRTILFAQYNSYPFNMQNIEYYKDSGIDHYITYASGLSMDHAYAGKQEDESYDHNTFRMIYSWDVSSIPSNAVVSVCTLYVAGTLTSNAPPNNPAYIEFKIKQFPDNKINSTATEQWSAITSASDLDTQQPPRDLGSFNTYFVYNSASNFTKYVKNCLTQGKVHLSIKGTAESWTDTIKVHVVDFQLAPNILPSSALRLEIHYTIPVATIIANNNFIDNSGNGTHGTMTIDGTTRTIPSNGYSFTKNTGTNLTLSAISPQTDNQNYQMVWHTGTADLSCWIRNGSIVSYNQTYSFNVTDDDNNKTFMAYLNQLKTTTSGMLSSDETWFTNVTLTGDVYVPTGVTLTITSDATVNLTNGTNQYSIISNGGTIVNNGSISNLKASLYSSSTLKGLCGSIQEGVDHWSSGETINTVSGTTNESITINNKNALQIWALGTTFTGTITIENCSSFVLNSPTINGGSISISNTSPFNIISLNSYYGGYPIYMSGSYGQIYGVISNNSGAGVYCYDTDCYVVEGSDITNEGVGVYLYNTSIGQLGNVNFCHNTWDIYTDGNSTGYCDYSTFSGNPSSTTYGNIVYSNYSICSLPKRMPSTSVFSKDPAFDDFVKASDSYFALLKKIHTENKDAISIDYSKYAADYSTVKVNFNSFITLNPNSKLAKTSLSAITHIYKAMNDYEGMKTYLDATTNNKDLSSLNGLARKYMMDYYCNQKDYTQALTIADDIVKEYSADTSLICYTLYSKGLIYQYSLDKKDEAQNIYESIITNYPDDASVMLAKQQLKNLGVEVKENKKAVSTPAHEITFTSSNYPNPFNPSTNINYSIPEDGKVVVKVFDVLGRELSTLVNEITTAGKHSVVWNGNNFASGIYFYSVTFKNQTLYNKMLMVK